MRRRLLAPCLLAVLVGAAHSAEDDIQPGDAVAAYAETVSEILGQALSDGRAYERLASLCATAPHRLSGSPGYSTAAEWARQTMEADGFSNVRLENVTVPRWRRGQVGRVRLVEPASHARDLPMLALGGSVATPEHGLTAEVVVVTSLQGAASLGAAARDRIVLFNGPMDPRLVNTFSAYGGAVAQRVNGATEAAKVGAVAALVRSMTTRLDDNPHTGGMRYASDVPPIPTAAISTRAAELVASLAASGERVVLHFEQDCHTLSDVENPNVIGELRGREFPEQIVLEGGHLDGWDVGQGAHDDGAGVCQSLEAVRLLMALGLQPRRTIRVVLFANEENGLRGARGYVAQHIDELPDHLFALESDSGGFSPRGFTSNANPEARAVIASIVALFTQAGGGQLWDGSGGADVNQMAAHGVVVAGLEPDPQRYFDYHHSPADTIDAVNPREINLGAGMMAALLYVIADVPEPLTRNPVQGR